jgi:hypothetical protein
VAKKNAIKGMSPFSNDSYMVEDDLRTLTRAAEIRRPEAHGEGAGARQDEARRDQGRRR